MPSIAYLASNKNTMEISMRELFILSGELGKECLTEKGTGELYLGKMNSNFPGREGGKWHSRKSMCKGLKAQKSMTCWGSKNHSVVGAGIVV